MALFRILLLLLLCAVSLSHGRPNDDNGEYFAASCTESCGSDRSLTGQSDHPLCTCTVVPRTLDKWLGWVIILEEAFKLTIRCRKFFLNFSTHCIKIVNNTGKKYVRILKQTAY